MIRLENYQELKELTLILQQYTDESLQRFEMVKKAQEKIEYDFFQDVKPYADLVKSTADKWKSFCLIWIENESPKHMHPPQIVSAIDNLNLISVQSFFKDSKEKRFKEMYHALQYLFENILEKLAEKG